MKRSTKLYLAILVAFTTALVAEEVNIDDIQKAFQEGKIEEGKRMLETTGIEQSQQLKELLKVIESQKTKVLKAERELQVQRSIQNTLHKKLASEVRAISKDRK